jgi:hypothetical protein
MTLYHISEDPNITLFLPRPAPNSTHQGAMVWAIAQSHLHNYLFARDCPRVCFMCGPETNPDDWQRLACGSTARSVIAIETAWFERLRNTTIYLYEMPTEPFECVDAGAGYYIAHTAIIPLTITAINDLPMALLARNVELRITPSLWPLRDAVVASTLEYSIIRMRNAGER